MTDFLKLIEYPLPNIYVDEDSILSSRYQTFRHGDLVYKRFIPEEYKQTGERSNIDVIKSLGWKLGTGNYFEELEIINFCGFEYMKYKYICQAQALIVPTSAQIIQLVHILATLHELGYVHSDIRSNNIIISQDGRAYIIDFDMVDHQGVNYPPLFNRVDIPERHCFAITGYPRKKEHDIYALKKIIETWKCLAVKANTLKDIAEEVQGL